MGARMLELELLPPGGAELTEGWGHFFSFPLVFFIFLSTWHGPVFNFEQGASVFQGVEQWLEMPGRPVGLTGACSNQCTLWWLCVRVCGSGGGVVWGGSLAINALCRQMLIKCGIWTLILHGWTKRRCSTRQCQSRDTSGSQVCLFCFRFFCRHKHPLEGARTHARTLTMRDS